MKLLPKIVSLFLVIALSCVLLMACSPEEPEENESQSASETLPQTIPPSNESEILPPQNSGNGSEEGSNPNFTDDSNDEFQGGDIIIIG